MLKRKKKFKKSPSFRFSKTVTQKINSTFKKLVFNRRILLRSSFKKRTMLCLKSQLLSDKDTLLKFVSFVKFYLQTR